MCKQECVLSAKRQLEKKLSKLHKNTQKIRSKENIVTVA